MVFHTCRGNREKRRDLTAVAAAVLMFRPEQANGGTTMGVARRIAELYEVKMNAVLDRATDPREMLDYSYDQLLDLLAEVRRAVADVKASRKAVELRVTGLQRAADRLEKQAEQAVAAGHEELARQALARRTAILDQVTEVRDQRAALRAEEDKLSATEQRLQAKIEAFRVRKETIKAAYTAARVQASISEAFAGISGDVTDADVASRRAEDKAAELQARASALEDLASESPFGAAPVLGDQLQAQLDEISTRAAVDEELARIKERLAAEAAKPDGGAGEGPATKGGTRDDGARQDSGHEHGAHEHGGREDGTGEGRSGAGASTRKPPHGHGGTS